MKSLLLALALFSTVASAEPFVIFKTNKNTITWVAYPETYYKTQDGYAIVIASRTGPAKNPEEIKAYVGVTIKDCEKKSGTLYSKMNIQDEWSPASNFAVAAGKSGADMLGEFICELGAEVDRLQGTQKKLTV